MTENRFNIRITQKTLDFLGLWSFTIEDYFNAVSNKSEIQYEIFRKEINKSLRSMSRSKLVEFRRRFTVKE